MLQYDNDFIGSFADENVKFSTQVIKQSSPSAAYWTPMIFVKQGEFVDTSNLDVWSPVPGNPTVFALSVDATDFAEFTTGLLRSWLSDLFINGYLGNAIIVALPGSDATAPNATLEALRSSYAVLKMYAYWKTICIAGTSPDPDIAAPVIDIDLARELCELCWADSEFISAAPCLPVVTESPTSDPLFNAIEPDTNADAFFTYHADETRNGSLYLLGLALAAVNDSGTSVGNTLDMQKSGNITPSGKDGTVPTAAVKRAMDNKYIGYFKPVGDNSGQVASEGGTTLRGRIIAAYWIKAYITYAVKVAIAQMITVRNFRKNASNYKRMGDTLLATVKLFGPGAGDQLTDLVFTLPTFDNLPDSDGKTIIIPNAWAATYVDNVHEVRITGTMYIGA